MDYPKSVPGVGLANGKFVDEDAVRGTPGSLIPASWGNGVTDELLAVIRAAQINPKEDDLDQLLEAIRYIVQNDAYTKNRVYNKEEMDALLKSNNVVPVGMMVPFPKAAIPLGYLEVDGSLQSIAAYPELAAYLGTSYNKAGDAAGYFRLPESRGEFLRGWDHGRGVDAGRGLGSFQADSLQGFRQESMRSADGRVGNDDGGVGTNGAGFAMGTATQGVRPRNLTGAFVSDGVNGEPRVGSETRGRNISVMWCIKAWNAPTNQGNIDIAALKALAVQATEINWGLSRIATQAEVNAGVDDATVVTPKKLRFGFAMSFTPASGYVLFPTWLGGLLIQYGRATLAGDTFSTLTWPLAWPDACYAISGAIHSSAARIDDAVIAQYRNLTKTSVILDRQDAISVFEGNRDVFVIGIGK
ncbi:phage tail protein [Pseudomonas cichorii]|uniref:phage tail protein n=1 Tax=Pseudomonas cichorii TaxID=36746 RepID=UPI001C86E5C3|nr:phage tail protein [Pseudomonas cichorii]MBX8542123.1 tail fiber protein [Pseudomonas cichorii]MBX8561913.1 tail fiber protein [Pseudomonas cichorii]MBX8566772.1 tail fiber protein [Pseudomonas cichorii]MBX8576517.1 tail fiber protein [Pseudomonas cichorii]MBX8581706.1 tail fiber protein [Pseudomonas cichorii]